MILPLCTLLIVEDSPVDQALYKRYLKSDASCRYRLLKTKSAVEGVELCRTSKTDAVLLGCSLSSVEGLTFLESLYAQGQVGRPSVVMVAAEGDTSIAVRAIKLGAEDYLVKQDLTPERLQLAMQSAVKKARLRLQLQEGDEGFRVSIQHSQEFEEHLSIGIQVAGVALAKFDYASDRVALSPKAATMYGFAADELEVSRDRIHATFHPDERSELLEIIKQVLNPEGPGWFARDHRVVWPSGEVRWLNVRKQVFFDRSGEVPRPNYALLAAIDVTERKRVEAEISQRESQVRRVLNSLFSFVGVMTPDGTLIEANRTALEAASLSPEDVLGKPFPDAYWWSYDSEIQDQLREAIQQAATGESVRYDVQVRLGEDLFITIDFGIAPLFDDAGQVEFLIPSGIDITERKQAEAALRESERKFSAIFNQTYEFIGLLSLDGVLLEVNQSALDSIAAQKNDIVGKNFWETPWWTHSQELQQQLREAIEQAANGEFVRYQVAFPDGNGEIMITNFSLKPVFDDAGRVVTIVGEGYDITDLKRTEAALRESEARFRTLADNISQLAWMADASGWIFWYNRRWFDYTGTTLDQMQGWGWQQVHHPEHLDRVVERFRACLEAGERWEDTFPLRGQDGTYRWFLSRAIPIINAEGKILRWFGTNTDVTDIKYAQATLEKRNQELDSFVHIVSHDLKAPLRAIANLSQWIEEDMEGSLSADTQEQMTLLRNRVLRMGAMIDGLLNYARVGRTDSTVELVEVEELLLEVIDSVAPPPTFTITIAPNLPTLYTKRLLLSQVFANLIGNALKHHDRVDGSVQVSVEDRGNFYEFAVTDDGPGIALEYQDSIFTIFQTGNPQNKQDSTGIGLAIVKKIVESEAGTICLESQVGKGTTFYFTWPKQPRIDT
jgi:PAS domain S-box-containing protein